MIKEKRIEGNYKGGHISKFSAHSRTYYFEANLITVFMPIQEIPYSILQADRLWKEQYLQAVIYYPFEVVSSIKIWCQIPCSNLFLLILFSICLQNNGANRIAVIRNDNLNMPEICLSTDPRCPKDYLKPSQSQ